MTRKLDDFFNVPPMPDQVNFDPPPLEIEEPTMSLITEQKQALDLADRIDQALPKVRDVESTDADLDEYAKKAMETYDRLVDLGMNVDDRNAGAIFDVASKMMSNAITAKNSKLDAKLRRIELQLKLINLQSKIDHILIGTNLLIFKIIIGYHMDQIQLLYMDNLLKLIVHIQLPLNQKVIIMNMCLHQMD